MKEKETVKRDWTEKTKERDLTQNKLKQNENPARAHRDCQTRIHKMWTPDKYKHIKKVHILKIYLNR